MENYKKLRCINIHLLVMHQLFHWLICIQNMAYIPENFTTPFINFYSHKLIYPPKYLHSISNLFTYKYHNFSLFCFTFIVHKPNFIRFHFSYYSVLWFINKKDAHYRVERQCRKKYILWFEHEIYLFITKNLVLLHFLVHKP